MSNFLRSRASISGLLLLLLLSLAYNGVWLLAVPSILEMRCKAHFAEVSADAITRKRKTDWTTAAHLYAYLILYHPYSENSCTIADDEANWKLPFGALALKWRYAESAEQNHQRTELELEGLRRAYSEVAEQIAFEGGAVSHLPADLPQ